MEYKQDCRWFSGYKPCKFKRSCVDCPNYSKPQSRIAIVSLEAMGAVLRSTCLLPPIKSHFPDSHITWITMPACKPLLAGNPYIDRIIPLSASTLTLVELMEFTHLFAVDKSAEAGALATKVKADDKRGFGVDKNGIIVPLNQEAEYQYQLGLDDELKFFINQKPETQQITESMGLPWERAEYILELNKEEQAQVKKQRHGWLSELGLPDSTPIIGYNTGCSKLFPYKKFTVSKAIDLVTEWRRNFPESPISLFGGPEDTDRQAEIKEHFVNDPFVINTPTTNGLRNGVLSMATSNLVFSGCSLGMHIAIGLKIPTIAWFGVSCIQEIDLYDRGIKIQSEVSCSPCWKKSCSMDVKCFNSVPLEKIISATSQLLKEP